MSIHLAEFDPFAEPALAAEPQAPMPTAPPVAGALGEALTAVCDALETTAFLTATPGLAVEPPNDVRRVTLSFGGPAAGTLSFLADARLGAALVANALGLDEADAATAGDDGLCELANVAAGAMMPRLVADGDAECPLGLPRVAAATAADWAAAAVDPRYASLDAEGRPLLVGLLGRAA